MSEVKLSLARRPRRMRGSASIREMVQETRINPSDLVQPFFIVEGKDQEHAIKAMPGQQRLSVDRVLKELNTLCKKSLQAIALFPAIDESKKDAQATEAFNPEGLVPSAIQKIKKEFPDLIVVSDVALDPYSSHGHDGIVKDGKVVNDLSVQSLAKMALCHAQAGVDIVAPSDMMDGRVSAVRQSLDAHDLEETSILSYAAKYASGLYGPFREALASAPKSGDKKTYQMNPCNRREAMLEAELDFIEGADILMVKPASWYLDIVSDLAHSIDLPIAAFQVSGEYSMIHSLANNDAQKLKDLAQESLHSIKRAGADLIFSYFAKDFL